jgi:NAD(P)-dependent dehydrogenase (short-subunit alcohol dehydrogenase family)
VTRTVVVSGSASGIGAATATRLEAEGCRIIGIDRQEATVVADLATADGRRAAIDGVTSLAGDRIDALVTCAGIAGYPGRPGGPVVAVNYFGSIALLEGLRPLLAVGEQPAAVAISSNSTTVQPGYSAALVDACLSGDEDEAMTLAETLGPVEAYPAGKTAVARWVRRNATRDEWAGAGICLNAVAPGMVETPLITEGRANPAMAPMLEAFPIPVGRPGRPEEIAAFLAFLLGPDARFFCGSLLFVDGGSDALIRPDDWPAIWQLRR